MTKFLILADIFNNQATSSKHLKSFMATLKKYSNSKDHESIFSLRVLLLKILHTGIIFRDKADKRSSGVKENAKNVSCQHFQKKRNFQFVTKVVVENTFLLWKFTEEMMMFFFSSQSHFLSKFSEMFPTPLGRKISSILLH